MNRPISNKNKTKENLDLNLTSKNPKGDFKITDIFDKDQLQSIQDAFALSHNISSIITDTEGRPFTRPSNLSPICNLVRNTKTGKALCDLSESNIYDMVRETLKPYSAKCLSCGFIENGVPVIVAGKHIANWKIGLGLNKSIDEKHVEEVALKYGIDFSLFLDAYKNTHFVKLEHFNKIVNFLWIMARDISSLGYNNILLTRDVEERKKSEKELIRSKNKAEESDRLKTSFLANISHEIRTPMNGILGLANILNEDDLTSEQRQEYIDLINQNGNILLKLFDDILDIAKMDTNQLTLDEKPFYLDQMMQELFQNFNNKIYQAKLKLIEFRLVLPENKLDTLVYGDNFRLRQIISNLLINAFKFTDKGLIEFGYSLDLPAHIRFFVKDTGIGLTAENRYIIFDKFRQADESTSKKYGGTGLGLAISKNLLKLMKGEIWVESEPGSGSSFYFTIPCIPYNDYDITQLIADKRIELSDVFADKQILIVEHEQLNFHMMYETFKKTSAKIIHANTGKEAVEKCKENNLINLVIIDIKMPDMDRYQAIKALKILNPVLPVIAVSNCFTPDEKLRCIEAGCKDFLLSPVSPALLLNSARSFLSKIEVRE